MRFVEIDAIRSWMAESSDLAAFARGVGQRCLEGEYVENALGAPVHLRFLVEELIREHGGAVPIHALDSIPFYSLCKGLFLPLSSLSPERAAHLFGLIIEPPPGAADMEALLSRFLQKDVGLGLVTKLGCILGDPFLGKPSSFRRNSLMRLLHSVQLVKREDMLNRLAMVGDVAVLFAESRKELRQEPVLTAAEVLETLRLLPSLGINDKFDILRSLLLRCGKLEAYFLAKLLLRRAGFGFDYQGPLLARVLAERFRVPVEHVAHAMALSDVFRVAEVLSQEGMAGLQRIQLKPLVPVRPALASGTVDQIRQFPVWVERKYDGIRMMLHRSTDHRGSVLAGAYTRTRRDWLEQVAGLEVSIKSLPAHSAIVDGELFGTVFDLDGLRPASVYEVYGALHGEQVSRPVSLKYAAFDIIYLNGQDLTGLSLAERRKRLSMVVGPVTGLTLPVPITLAEGQMADSMEDLNRLYHHFRAQGYEGVISKDLMGPYRLSSRDASWMKRKPLITLDLVLMGAVYAVTSKERAGLFGSYVIGARLAEGGYVDVGDVAGVDRVRDGEIQAEILREGLLTGRRLERASASGVRPGVDLRPSIVVTVKFEGIVRDSTTRELKLRDPKLVMIRSDKGADEADSMEDIEELFLKQRFG